MAKKESKGSSSNEQIKALLASSKEHYNYIEDTYYKVSTGSLVLDIHTGGGLMPGVHRFCGINEGGKTSEALEVARNFQLDIPNSKVIYIKAEGRLSKEVIERSGLNFSEDKWFVLESNVYDFVFDFIKSLIQENDENKLYMFVIDSMDGLITRGDLDKGISDATKVAGGAVIGAAFLKRVANAMTKFGHMCVMISQVRDTIKIDPYTRAPFKNTSASGGNALLHYANFIFEFEGRYNKDLILQDSDQKYDEKKNKVIGHEVKITVKKSPNEKSNTVVSYPIRYGRKNGTSIWKEREIRDLLFENGQFIKSGAWVNVEASVIKQLKEKGIDCPEKFQGRDSILDFMDKNPKFVEYWYGRFKSALSPL